MTDKAYTLSDFDFDLPEALIAQFPAETRTQSRLLVVRDTFEDALFPDIVAQFNAGDVLVRNNTKVVPARLFGQKSTGGKIEILVERVTSDKVALCMIRASKSPKIDDVLNIAGVADATVTARQGVFFEVKLLSNLEAAEQSEMQGARRGESGVYTEVHEYFELRATKQFTCTGVSSWLELMYVHGHIPLPPYIEREANDTDVDRYQTVYAKDEGAVAAPTAGLHFDEEIFSALRDKGVTICDVTLHVGAGTFQPVKTENLAEHQMHFERYEVDQAVVDAVKACKQNGGKVVAIGTTSVRALESASQSNELEAGQGDSNLFITPGYEFRTVDALLTNFHLPKSSLMMLVTALAGYDRVMAAYEHAIAQKYRFFSYGDAMFLTRES